MADLMDALDEAAGKAPAAPPVYANPRMDALAVAAGHPSFSDPRVPIQQRVENFSKMAVSSGLPWEEVAKAGQDQLGISPDQLAQHYNLAGARSQESGEEDLATTIGRRSVPFASAGIGVLHAEQYKDAKKRFDEGTATAEDTRTIARYQALQGKEANQSTGAAVLSGLAHIPAVLGEFGAGGKAARYIGGKLAPRVGGAVGRALGGEAVGTAGQATQYAGRQLATTALAPSMYAPEAEQRSIEQGGEAYSGKNVVPAFAKGYAATLVLGSLQRLGSGGENLNRLGRAIQAVPTQAGRTAALTGVGMTEQAGVDTAGALADEVLNPAWKFRTKYGGALGEYATAKPGDESKQALKNLVVQTATFATFSYLHSGKPPAETMRKLADALDEAKASGKSEPEAAKYLADVFDKAEKDPTTVGDKNLPPTIRDLVKAKAEATVLSTFSEAADQGADPYRAVAIKYGPEAAVAMRTVKDQLQKGMAESLRKGAAPILDIQRAMYEKLRRWALSDTVGRLGGEGESGGPSTPRGPQNPDGTPKSSLAMLPPEGTVPQTETNANIGGPEVPPSQKPSALDGLSPEQVKKLAGSLGLSGAKGTKNGIYGTRQFDPEVMAARNRLFGPHPPQIAPDAPKTAAPIQPTVSPPPEPVRPVEGTPGTQNGQRFPAGTGHGFTPGLRASRDTARERFPSYEELAKKGEEKLGFTTEQTAHAKKYGYLGRDIVTEFNEGRAGTARDDTLARAQEWVKEKGEPGTYVDIDLKNLGGLNAMVAEDGRTGASNANRHFHAMAKIVEAELYGVKADTTMFRHGGDEMSAVVVNADKATVEAAMERAQEKIQRYAVKEKIDKAVHPKHPDREDKRGTGIHFGATEIVPGKEPTDIYGAAEKQTEGKKKYTGLERRTTAASGEPPTAPPAVPPTLADAPRRGTLAEMKARIEAARGKVLPAEGVAAPGEREVGTVRPIFSEEAKELPADMPAAGGELNDRESYVMEQRRLGRTYRDIAGDKQLREKGEPISHQTVANIQKRAEEKTQAKLLDEDKARLERLMDRSTVKTEEGRVSTTHTDEGFSEVGSRTNENLSPEDRELDRLVQEYHDRVSAHVDRLVASGRTKEDATKRALEVFKGHADRIEELANKQLSLNKEIIDEQANSESGDAGRTPPVRRGGRASRGPKAAATAATTADAGTPPGPDAARPGPAENGGAGQPAAASNPPAPARRGAKSGNQLADAAAEQYKKGSMRRAVKDKGGLVWDAQAKEFFGSWKDVQKAGLVGIFSKDPNAHDIHTLAHDLHETGELSSPDPQLLADKLKSKALSDNADTGDINAQHYQEWVKAQEDEHNGRSELLRQARAEGLPFSEVSRDLGEAHENADRQGEDHAQSEIDGATADETQGRSDATPEPDHAGADDFAFGANEPSANIGGSDPTRGAPRAGGLSAREIERLSLKPGWEGPPGEGQAGGMGAASASPATPPTPPPNPRLAAAREAIRAGINFAKDNWNELAGHMAPRTSRLHPEAGDAMARAAAAPEYAKRAAPAITEEVLGPIRAAMQKEAADSKIPFQEERFQREAMRLMAAFEEMRHRYARENFKRESDKAAFASAEARNRVKDAVRRKDAVAERNALAEAKAQSDRVTEMMGRADGVTTLIGRENASMENEKQYQETIASPEFREFLQRWKENVVPVMDTLHKRAKGMDPSEEIESLTQLPGLPYNAKRATEESDPKKTVWTGDSAKGNLRNVQLKRSPFERGFTGSGDGYVIDPAEIIEHSISRVADLAAHAEMDRTLVGTGLAKWIKPSDPTPEVGGVVYRRVPKVSPPKGSQEAEAGQTDMAIHPESYNEYVKVRELVDPFKKIPTAQAFTTGALLSIVEGLSHTKNLITGLFSVGGRTLIQVPKIFWGVVKGSPEVMRRVTQLAEIGATKPAGMESAAEKPFKGGKLNPLNLINSGFKWVGRALDTIDLTMRLTLDKAFDRLVARDIGVENTEANRRNFINQVGQYHKRAANDIVGFLKQTGLGPFAVAATNYTMQGIRNVFFSSGLRTNSYANQARLRTEKFLRIGAFLAASAALNYALWKRPDGDDNTPLGAVKIQDKDGKTGYLDLASFSGFTRGARTIGLLALAEGQRAGAATGNITERARKDIVHGLVHPAQGPWTNVAMGAASGENAMGMPIGEKAKEGENQTWLDVRGALLNVNPTVATFTGADRPREKNPSDAERAWRLLGPFAPKFRSSPPGGENATVTEFHQRVKTLETQKKQSVVKGEKWQSEGELKKLHHAAEQMAALDRQLRGETLRAGRIIPGPKPDSQTAEAIRKKQADVARQAMGR